MMRHLIALAEALDPTKKAADPELSRDDLLEDVGQWTSDALRRAPQGHSLVVAGPQEAMLSADRYSWSYDPTYPVARITPGAGHRNDEWADWMREEIKMWTEEGQPDRYDSMFSEPIYDPVILVEINNTGYLWDGCHRTGASVIQHHKTIPAIVGHLLK